MMRTFLLKIVLFFLINFGLLTAVLLYCSGRHSDIRIPVSETESNIFSVAPNSHYDLVLLGTSRSRVFSRDGNHQVMETILGRKVANLSKGGGGGLMPAEIHLKHFFDRGNSTEHIIYLLDPWIFFAAINNENNAFFLRDEPFELSIFLHLLRERYPLKRLSAYLQMIPDRDWQELSRYKEPGMAFRTLKKINAEKQEKARAYYLKTYKDGDFARYSCYLEKIHNLARKNNCRLSFVLLPILMEDFPGAEKVDARLRKFTDKNRDVTYWNLISALQDQSLFYDHMHFNRTGITRFCENVLLPLISTDDKMPPANL